MKVLPKKQIFSAVIAALFLAIAGVYSQQGLDPTQQKYSRVDGMQLKIPHQDIAQKDAVIPSITPLEVEEVIPPPPPLYAQIAISKHGTLKQGDTFMKALKREGVPAQARQQIIHNLASCLDFRRLRPGDNFHVDLDHEENLLRCTYESDALHKYTVVKQDDAYVAARDEIPMVVKTISLSGTVESSLFSSFNRHKLSPKLIYSFADIFASQLDFNTETRAQDSYAIVYEEYYRDENFIGYGNILYARYQQSNGDLHEGFYREDKEGHGSHYSRDGEELGTSFIRSPVPMARVSSKFSWRRKHPILGVVRPHLGVDLAAPYGTPVMAASDGKIIFRGRRGGFGKQIIIKHPNGYKTYYGHLSRYSRGTARGNKVKQKQIIGYVGSTGLSTGPHLDYRVSENGQFKNPFALKFKPRSILKGGDKASLDQSISTLMAKLSTSEEKIIAVRLFVLKPDDTITLL